MSIATKKDIIKKQIILDHKCSGPCIRCTKIHRLIDKMEEARIPIGYWKLTMNNFQGAPKLKELVDDYTKNIQENYLSGKSICLAGTQGTGKTMSAICILKEAIKQNLSTHYITAADLLNEMTNSKTNHDFRNLLKYVDFLVIDELDSRFFNSDSAKELFSGIYENIFRFRTHNTMPTIICSNEQKIS